MAHPRHSLVPYLATLAASIGSATAAVDAAPGEAGAPADAARVLIRHHHDRGRALRYRLRLSGSATWTPGGRQLQTNSARTDFTFALRPKALRTDGGCTFAVLGEHLASRVEGPEGALTVDATPDGATVAAGKRRKLRWDANPFEREMTITIGPDGTFQFGTGLGPIVVFLLPHADHRFWSLLTRAPPDPIGPGDHWEEQFDLAAPGAAGRPLAVEAAWEVLGWRHFGGERVLALSLKARLSLAGTELLLNNGDLVQVTRAVGEASGTAFWHTGRGVLCHAEARQRLRIQIDRPVPRALRSEHECALKLLELGPERPLQAPTGDMGH